MVEEDMWKHYLAKANFKKYPGSKLKPIYDEYVEDVYYQFEQTGGLLQNPTTGEYTSYWSIDSFAIAYLGLTYSGNLDWHDAICAIAEEIVGKKIITHYIIDKLGIEIDYDEDNFNEAAYYESAIDVLVTVPDIITLDERHAYPYPEN